jgi:hypothetical protein
MDAIPLDTTPIAISNNSDSLEHKQIAASAHNNSHTSPTLTKAQTEDGKCADIA